MSDHFEFHVTNDYDKLLAMYSMCGSEWSGKLTPEEFGEVESKSHLDFLNSGGEIQGFYLEDSSNGNVVATTVVKRMKGFYKAVDKSNAISSIPDPTLIGVKNISLLLIAYVFTHRDYRKRGLAQSVVSQAICHTESQIIKEKINESNDEKGSFKNMVVTDGEIDEELANYYLSKEYFWYLYSGAGLFYEKFGFKAFPLDFYKVPSSSLTVSRVELIEQLVDSSPMNQSGKSLKWLRGSNVQDQELIKFILQSKELEIVTELNKSIFHSELQGNQKSSSSLTSMSSLLHMTKADSENVLHSITEVGSKVSEKSGTRRRSSVHHFSTPKIAVKPDYRILQRNVASETAAASKATNQDTALAFTDIQGAILTNELQQKSYYIIWNSLTIGRLYVLSVGELKFEPYSSAGILPGRRRRSSFTGLNELGGYNFQDLDILLSIANYVGQKRELADPTGIYVSINDLPTNIPTELLYDYLNSYLGSASDASRKEQSSEEERTSLVPGGSQSLGVLPMLKIFGKKTPEFDLDWIASGMWSWG
ncbi:predicted protein [Scheffersomyces stipitis CBS 6054]|uniref:N-acetyltransferase domain-containing protein n=1 Tax=Scheffersomyces stipitis (strain ATCC 58785 / CBS 6054 / NBRC 10063 / NRRL Y-11545) TaxID=322104 RepID=A3LVE4_PICST|nr:predicted protein [Scheffersomyces stipitis CBS 6054]ABN67106.2 predicted protein [Scheffersomyces stipitis CBS 6054]KAG2734287.1 hypothetical protein G9P44_002293 [Scheffersomyces stipitis]